MPAPRGALTGRPALIPPIPNGACLEYAPSRSVSVGPDDGPAELSVRRAWQRFATELDLAACGADRDRPAHLRAVTRMLSAQGCLAFGQPAPRSRRRLVAACRRTVAMLLQQASGRPLSAEITNLVVASDRAYGDVLAVGNVRFRRHGAGWRLTEV